MKSLPEILSFESSFSKHRSNCNSQQFALEISLSKTLSTPNWAPLPSPPMSGSPPPQDPPETPQVAGRRRKRSTTPPTPATAAAADRQTHTEQASGGRRATQRREAAELATSVLTAPNFPSSYQSAHSFGYGPGGPAIVSATTITIQPQLGSGEVSPRATRKTKAHVASACVNCKKKHLRCDNARPCRRCVQSGKEASCIDVEHKKRGRPPLKPEENHPRRPFDSAMSPLQGHLAGFHRLPAAHSSSYSSQQPTRDLRPLPSGSDTGRPAFLRPAPAYQAIYAQPTVSPTPTTAAGTMSRPAHVGLVGHSQAQTPYSMTQSSGMNALGPENFSHYAGSYSYMSSQATAPYSLFPRTSNQMQSSRHTTSPPSYGHMHAMSPDLRLPPIQPAPPGGSIDPAMAQQQRQAHQQSRTEQQSGNGTTRQPDPKRPKISDILRND